MLRLNRGKIFLLFFLVEHTLIFNHPEPSFRLNRKENLQRKTSDQRMTNLYHVRFVRGVARGQDPGVPVTPPL